MSMTKSIKKECARAKKVQQILEDMAKKDGLTVAQEVEVSFLHTFKSPRP